MDMLRRAFRDIAAGFSSGTTLGKPVYVKHLSYADQIDQDDKRDQFYKDAKDQGLSTFDERMVTLRKEGLWTDKMDREISEIKQMLDGMHEGKKTHLKMPSMVEKLNNQIKEEEAKLQATYDQRDKLVGLTCEVYADRENSDYYIFHNLFSDKELTTPFFQLSDFEYLEEDALEQVGKDYVKIMAACTEHNVKKLAMQPFFQSYFVLTGEILTNFFGKPVCALTVSQMRLLNFGSHFRYIYQNHDVSQFPKTVTDDPDVLTDYAMAAAKGKEELQKQGAQEEGSVVLGLKKEDRMALGVKNQTNVAQEIIKNGGNVIEWATKRG